MADVTRVCMRTVVSTKPIQPGIFHYFSVLDRVMEPIHLRMVLYYTTPADSEPGEITSKLRESFSEMLTNFPMVTGRLQRTPEGYWKIKCNDAGVRTIEERAEGSVEEWLQTVDRERELKLIYWEEMYHKPYFWSTFYLQLTEFEKGGIAIGLSCMHLLADATCATMLIKAWADTTLLGKMFSPPHFHPLPPQRLASKNADHTPYTDLIDYYKASLQRTNLSTVSCNTTYATVTFVFSDEMVRKCMTEARDGGDVSPFVALASLFWVSLSKLKGKTEALINASLCLDGRNVLGLDKGFFGNCMIFNQVPGKGVSGLIHAASAIENIVKKMGNQGIMDLIEFLESEEGKTSVTTDQKPLPPMNGPDLVFANWEYLDPYSAIFESDNKPLRVSYYFERVFGEGQVLVLPSPEKGLSRVVMVTLPEDEAVKLCQDDLVGRFSPTVLMGARKTKVECRGTD